MKAGSSLCAQIFGQVQETLVAGELIAGEQSAQQPDRYLEILDVNVAVEGEIADDERARLGRFGVELHQDEGVERIDRRHEQRLAVPVVGRLAQRLQRIVSPGVTLVVIPGVQKLGSPVRPFAARALSSRARLQPWAANRPTATNSKQRLRKRAGFFTVTAAGSNAHRGLSRDVEPGSV